MYTVRENPPKDIQDALQVYEPLTQRLLYTRGITNQQEAESFFKKEWAATNPYHYNDMEKAARRLLDAVAAGETIGIISDYDCDGIPAAAILYVTLSTLGHKKITHYIPNRNADGFGLNKEGIDKMINHGASVVCILDCGTSNPEEVATMSRSGIDTIILDHHLAGETVPESFAMINPALEANSPEPHPCAAGVTYLLLQALIQQAQQTSLTQKPPIGWEKWQLDIVGLATISDMVPMRGINRQFAHYGLQVFRKSPRPGIQALCSALNIDQRSATQDEIAFLIIPRINAASRMGEAETAFSLLTTDDIEKAITLTETLSALNNKRKTTVATMTRSANRQAEQKNKGKEVWVFGSREWKPSLVGLVAQKISESYGKTVFVWGQGGDETKVVIKGSCRSATCDVHTIMQNAADMFAEYGGHRQAGGFTLAANAEVALEDALNAVAVPKEQSRHTHTVDTECQANAIAAIHQLGEQFAPFGIENEPIRIAIPHCTVQEQFWFGKNKEHARYTFSDDTGRVHGIAFFAKDSKTITAERNQTLRAVIGQVEWDAFRGRPHLRVTQVIH